MGDPFPLGWPQIQSADRTELRQANVGDEATESLPGLITLNHTSTILFKPRQHLKCGISVMGTWGKK